MEAVVLGSFDDLRSRDVRLLQEAARIGAVHVLLLSDGAHEAREGESPKFPLAERLYLLEAIRFVDTVTVVHAPPTTDELPPGYPAREATWLVSAGEDAPAKRSFCADRDIRYSALPDADLEGFPLPWEAGIPAPTPGRPRVFATGCYDWLHSGHVRFFVEASALGDLHVTVGNDESVRAFKGPGHPMHTEEERRYMVAAIRHVTRCLVATGSGWLDAAAEIERLRPDVFVVNEDGDRVEKRAFCDAQGIDYRVLRRLPAEGLPARASTRLRGY